VDALRVCNLGYMWKNALCTVLNLEVSFKLADIYPIGVKK